jgi:hypothetical protein
VIASLKASTIHHDNAQFRGCNPRWCGEPLHQRPTLMFSDLSLSLTNIIGTDLAADSLDLFDRQPDSGQLLQSIGSVLITSQIGPRPDNLF